MSRFARRAWSVSALSAVFALSALSPAWAASAGAPGGGDPYFPGAGNGGYDVGHYDLELDYSPNGIAGDLNATATITATATQSLSAFNLDLRDLTVSAVTVNGAPAAFTQKARELTIEPARVLRRHSRFVVRVSYAGRTGQPEDNTGALYGWVSFPDGALVANEPDGASTWFPVNDIPTDKARYDFRITVPEGTVGVANGELLGSRTVNGRTTYRWRAKDEMASYLAMAGSGNYAMTTGRAQGIPILNFVDKDLTPANRATTEASLALQPEMLRFFSRTFGRYPFHSFGAVVDDDSVGYALENQTRPVYSRRAVESTVAHELAHQWFGDKVTPGRWKDIWLNEGFATYATWLWNEHRGKLSVQESFDEAYNNSDADWTTVIADPGATGLFNEAVYDRGAMTLHAIRVQVGDRDFFRILKAWARHRGPASTAGFQRVAESVSGEDLDALFQTWVYQAGQPAKP